MKNWVQSDIITWFIVSLASGNPHTRNKNYKVRCSKYFPLSKFYALLIGRMSRWDEKSVREETRGKARFSFFFFDESVSEIDWERKKKKKIL